MNTTAYTPPAEGGSLKPLAEVTAMDHFLRLAKEGGRQSASTGEKAARRLADIAVYYVPGLDDAAIDGLIEFILITKKMPMSARDLIHR